MQFWQGALGNYRKYLADPKKKDYFTLAATLGLLIVLLLMIYPAALHVSRLNKEVSDGNALKEQLETKTTSLEKAQFSYNSVKEDLILLNQALPVGSDVKNYIKNPLETLAQKHSLTIKSLQFSDVPISTPNVSQALSLREFTFSASFGGSFATFQSFMTDLENFTRITKISQVEITKDQANALTLTITAHSNFLDIPINLIPNANTQGVNNGS